MTNRKDIAKPTLYLMVLGDEAEYVKIGVTSNLARRIRNVLTASPLMFKCIHHLDCKDMPQAKRLEKWFQEFMRSKWIRGEWYDTRNGGYSLLEQAMNVITPTLDQEWALIEDVGAFIDRKW